MKVLVLYASQTGNARGLAKELVTRAVDKGHEARVLGMEDFKKISFEEEPIVVVIASSTGNGDCPDNADKFHRYCKRKTTPQFLSSSRFAVLALGDSNYEAFCQVGKEFDKFFENVGGQRFLKRVDVDEVEGIETFYEPWAEQLWTSLEAMETATGAPAAPTAPTAAAPAAAAPAAAADTASKPSQGKNAPVADDEDDDRVGRSASKPLQVPVVAARWLTSTPADGRTYGVSSSEGSRRVLHVEVDVSAGGDAMSFEPGDALGVLPHNPDEEVASLLRRLGVAQPEAPLPALADGVPAHLQGCASVREALTSRLDIGSVSVWPALPLLRLLLASARPSGERDEQLVKLMELATDAGNRTAALAAHAALQKQRPSLVELLDGSRCAPPLAALLDTLPPLAPRYYSIANAPAAEPGRMHLCLSIVEYFTTASDGSRRARLGLTSNMIARVCQPLLDPASRGAPAPSLSVFRRAPSGNELRLPKDPATPIAMVGPGTGLAPFRGFLQQRRHGWSRKQLGDCHLFFGCRSPKVDFLYSSELTAMAGTGALQLHTAFSRDGEACAAGTWRGARVNVPYVQDKIEDEAAALCDLLFEKKGRIYVCGDGQAMASDVHAALRLVTARQLRLSDADAEAELSKLADEGRYCREIWN